MIIILMFFVILLLLGAFLFGNLYIYISHYNFKYNRKNYDLKDKDSIKKDFKVGMVLTIIPFVLLYVLLQYLLSL